MKEASLGMLPTGTRPLESPMTGTNHTQAEDARLNQSQMQRSDVLPPLSQSMTPITTSKNIELVESASMSLLDRSADHMFELMKGLSGGDSADVNAACNCAKNIQSLMRLKLDAMKLQKEWNK